MAEFEDSITAVIFFCGCDMNCQYCQNPQLLAIERCENLSIKEIINRIEWDVIDWLSLSGGEPIHSIILTDDENALIKLLAEARIRGVKVNIDTNGYYGDIRKESLLKRISHMVDCFSVDIKYINKFWIQRLKSVLTNANVFDKCRFRMVAFNGKYYKDPSGIMEMEKHGINDIKLIQNSCGGRGKIFGHTNEKLVDDMIKYFNEYGVRLIDDGR